MNEEIAKSIILQGLLQVDSSFFITDFFMDYDSSTRKLAISFTAQTDDGEEISEVISYA